MKRLFNLVQVPSDTRLGQSFKIGLKDICLAANKENILESVYRAIDVLGEPLSYQARQELEELSRNGKIPEFIGRFFSLVKWPPDFGRFTMLMSKSIRTAGDMTEYVEEHRIDPTTSDLESCTFNYVIE